MSMANQDETRWHRTAIQIRFRRELSTKERVRVDHLLEIVDYDCPSTRQLEYDTVAGWRGPMVTLRQLLSLLHAYGFPCQGRWCEWDWLEEDEEDALERIEQLPWIESEPDLRWLHSKRASTVLKPRLLHFSRRFARYL